MVDIVNKETHIELALKNSTHSKTLFFFLGFHQIAEKFINKFTSILLDLKSLELKIILVKMKSYSPDASVGFFLSEDQLKEEKEIYSYYRIKRDDYCLITEIYWDAEFDLKMIQMIKEEYIKVNFNWKNIMIAGFSMGGRYATHLIELLEIEAYSMIFLKTYIMQYCKGESQIENIIERSRKRMIDKDYLLIPFTKDPTLHNQLNPTELGRKDKFIPQTFYSSNYNSLEEINLLYEEVNNFLKYQKLNNKTEKLDNSSKFAIDKLKVYLRYSLDDPLVYSVLVYTLDILQSQINMTTLSYDNDDKHNINSTIDLLKFIINDFLNRPYSKF